MCVCPESTCVSRQNYSHTKCLIKKMFSSLSLVYLLYMITVVLEVSGGLEVVDDPADGLDVGVLGLPLVMAAVVSTLHDVHATAEVWLLVHHPAEEREDRSHQAKFKTFRISI